MKLMWDRWNNSKNVGDVRLQMFLVLEKALQRVAIVYWMIWRKFVTATRNDAAIEDQDNHYNDRQWASAAKADEFPL